MIRINATSSIVINVSNIAAITMPMLCTDVSQNTIEFDIRLNSVDGIIRVSDADLKGKENLAVELRKELIQYLTDGRMHKFVMIDGLKITKLEPTELDKVIEAYLPVAQGFLKKYSQDFMGKRHGMELVGGVGDGSGKKI